jgi:cell division protein ZapE
MTPIQRYRSFLKSRTLKPDAAQEKAAERLDRLYQALEDYQPRRTRFFTFTLGLRGSSAPKGLYIHGDVGRGKSALMDLFFASVSVPQKKRVHFNAFMAETHRFIHEWRNLSTYDRKRRPKYTRSASEDPIAPAANHIAASATLLCLDEFQVLDVADAMILGRLFEKLLELGVVIVLTSNTEPDHLYEGGINRQLFLPFIVMIKQRLDLVELNGPLDYRLDRMAGVHIYNTPLGPSAERAMDDAWYKLTGTAKGESLVIDILGRQFVVPETAEGIARLSFEALCGSALGAADYLALADSFHTILLDGIPQLGPGKSNEARRFTMLIDTLYDRRSRLICSAAARPEQLYVSGDNAAAFRRAASRLLEMQSTDYQMSAGPDRTALPGEAPGGRLKTGRSAGA